MENDSSIERKIQRMRGLMAGIDNVYVNIKSERHSFYQALLSLGDRRVAPAIEAAERNGGDWRAAVAESQVDAHFFVFRDRSRDPVLPWDIIDGGMKADFFRSEFDKSLKEGQQMLLAVRRRQIKEYVQRVRVAGFGERFENGRANPVLEQYVNA